MLSDYHNEISVIGSLLISPETLDVISGVLTPADFDGDKCKAAYIAALQLRDEGEVVDPISISERMSKLGCKNNGNWIMECMQLTPTAANVELYCRVVKQDANRRRLVEIADKIGEGVDECADWQEIASQVVEEIDGIKDSTNTSIVSSLDMANDWLEYYDKVSKNPDFAYCKTGFQSLDKKLGGGMYKQGMYIIGARPGMGKTTLGINVAENIAKAGKTVLFVSLEMSRKQIMAKRIALETGLGYTKLMSGTLSASELEIAVDALGRLADEPFLLIDESKMTVSEIGRAARRIKDLSAIVIDYLGLVRPETETANKPRYEEMTDISANIKALAKKLKIPVVVLCQLNRESTKRNGSRPQLQDLRDTGAIEQDADAVILLHRPEYYADKTAPDYVPPEREKMELIVAKNRHGETGIVEMIWQGSTGSIFEIDYTHSDLPL